MEKFLEIAKRRAKKGSGSAKIHWQKRTAMIKQPDLRGILEPIQWAVVGGVATRAYMPERATIDLDILIKAEDSKKARELMRSAGCKYLGELSIGGSSWQTSDGHLVDIVESDEIWVSEALEELNRDAQGLPVVRLPYLVLMKLCSGRTQDLADISRMLGLASNAEVRKTREIIEKYQPDDLEDLESLISLGRLELKEETMAKQVDNKKKEA